MANSRTLLVYVLALVVCGGGNGGLWVSANTASIISGKEPLIGTTGATSPSQQQTRPQHHYTQFYTQQQQPQLQKVPETSMPTPSQSSSSLPPPSSSSIIPRNNNNNNAPSTLSVKNGFGFSAGSSRSGPYTSGYGYISGRTLNQPNSPYMTDYDVMPVPSARPGTAVDGMMALLPDWSNWNHANVDWTSAIMGAMLGAGVTMYAQGGRLSGLFPFVRETVVELRNQAKVPATPTSDPELASASTPDAASNSTSSRRRRNVEFDTDLTELATVVLSAIQSGECMQRSICLLGSRIGGSDKGKMGFLLVDKLIPESVQGSQYFVTLKKALRGGESYCDRFRCRFN